MPSPSQSLADALADRYRIERELGEGGMATVYLAQDVRHERRVALKVVRPDIAAALGPERFLREIKITAGLSHPHILPLLDSGEADGHLFYVMPFVDGESLRDKLAREKQLPLDDALQIAREVADALSFAHARGVIHRDIKPENILLQAGHAVVADFGIARAIDAAGGGRLTETGMAVGTPVYMSPEQASGSADVDGRSDLYSLGCVLYEMLAGQPPFTGPTAESVVHQHLSVDAPSITRMRPAVPPPVAEVLARALAKTPADRFNPVAQFSDSLRVAVGPSARAARRNRVVPAALGLVAVAAIVAAVVFLSRGARSATLTGGGATPSIAVLPFVDLSGGASEYLGDGIAETLITALSKLEGLRVAARTSAFSFKGRNEDVRTIGEALGVASVLEGSVQRAGDRIRVTAQLVNAGDGFHLWSESFDRDVSDIFAVQDEVARAVVRALELRLLSDPARPVTAQGTESFEAYNAYLQGRFFWNKRTAEDLVRAAALFEEAIAADSNFARAWAGLAATYFLYTPSEYDVTVIPWQEALEQGEAAAHRALAIDPRLADAHTALAAILEKRLALDSAGTAYRRAIELDPRYATARQWYGTYLAKMGRPEEGLEQLRRAEEADPLSLVIVVEVAELLDVLGRTDEATTQYEKALRMFPDVPLVQFFSGLHFLMLGEVARATGVLEQAALGLPYVARSFRLTPGDTNQVRALGAGLRDPVTRRTTLETIGETARTPDVAVAAYRALGDADRALAALERAVDGPDAIYVYVPHVLAMLGPELRTHPRAVAALDRLLGR